MYFTRRYQESFQREIMYCCVRRCVMAAHETINSMQLLQQQGRLNSFWHNSHYVFAALGVMIVFHTLDKQSKADIALPPSLNVDKDVAQGTEFLDKIGAQMHSLASRYVQTIRQLHSRLQAMSTNIRATDTATGPTELACANLQRSSDHISNGLLLEGSQVPRSRVQVDGDPTLTFEYDFGDLENLLASPGWTGLMDEWTGS